jgi:hypothetical protein
MTPTLPRQTPLVLVEPVPAPTRPRPLDDPEALAILVTLLVTGLVPLAGEFLGGSWGRGTLGVATLLVLLSGRGLVTQLRSLLLHPRRRSSR